MQLTKMGSDLKTLFSPRNGPAKPNAFRLRVCQDEDDAHVVRAATKARAAKILKAYLAAVGVVLVQLFLLASESSSAVHLAVLFFAAMGVVGAARLAWVHSLEHAAAQATLPVVEGALAGAAFGFVIGVLTVLLVGTATAPAPAVARQVWVQEHKETSTAKKHHGMSMVGKPFKVDMEHFDIDGLKKAIKATKAPELDHVAADSLTIYHITFKTRADGSLGYTASRHLPAEMVRVEANSAETAYGFVTPYGSHPPEEPGTMAQQQQAAQAAAAGDAHATEHPVRDGHVDPPAKK
jgi:hypothetical protein